MCYIPFVFHLFPYTTELPGPPTGVQAAEALFLTLFAYLGAARNPTSSWTLSCVLVKVYRGYTCTSLRTQVLLTSISQAHFGRRRATFAGPSLPLALHSIRASSFPRMIDDPLLKGKLRYEKSMETYISLEPPTGSAGSGGPTSTVEGLRRTSGGSTGSL